MTTTDLRYRSSFAIAAPRWIAAGLIVFGVACHKQPPATQPPPPAPVPTAPPVERIGRARVLVAAMRDRYPQWYRTITITQKTTLSTPSGGAIVQTWYEAAALPGKLRIDTDLAQKTGTLFANDSIYSFANGKRMQASAGLNELLVLGFDAYTQPAARTEAQLRGRGFNLERFHEGTWRGQPVYIVGAEAGDTTSKQFWVTKDKLLFVRMIEPGARGLSDIRFENYVPAGRGWIAARVEQYVGGTRRVLEEYTDVRADVPLSDALFDPAQWATAPTWVRPRPAKH
jgi:hypothetical protein